MDATTLGMQVTAVTESLNSENVQTKVPGTTTGRQNTQKTRSQAHSQPKAPRPDTAKSYMGSHSHRITVNRNRHNRICEFNVKQMTLKTTDIGK